MGAHVVLAFLSRAAATAAAAFPAFVAISLTGSIGVSAFSTPASLKNARTASMASPRGSLSAAGPSRMPPKLDSLAALSRCLMDAAGKLAGALGSSGSGIGWESVRRARLDAWCSACDEAFWAACAVCCGGELRRVLCLGAVLLLLAGLFAGAVVSVLLTVVAEREGASS